MSVRDDTDAPDVSVGEDKDEPRVNGRVDVPVGGIDDVAPVPDDAEV